MGGRQFRGGFYGLSGLSRGLEVSRSRIASFNRDTDDAVNFKALYKGQYHILPKRTGTDYRNYYDTATYQNFGTGSWGSVVVTAGGTAYTATTCSTPLSCAVGIALSVVAVILAPPQSTDYPVILQPNTGGIGNPPSISSLNPPNGIYR